MPSTPASADEAPGAVLDDLQDVHLPPMHGRMHVDVVHEDRMSDDALEASEGRGTIRRAVHAVQDTGGS